MERKRFMIGMLFLFLFAALGFYFVAHQQELRQNRVLLKAPDIQSRAEPGDYFLLLEYDIGRIPAGKIDGGLIGHRVGDAVYVKLSKHNDRAQVEGLFSDLPQNSPGLYLLGVVRGRKGDSLIVHYGIESFTIPEDKREAYDQLDRPFEIEIEITPDNRAKLIGLVSKLQAVRFIDQ